MRTLVIVLVLASGRTEQSRYNLFLAAEHLALCSVLPLRVLVPEEMEHPVDNEPQQFGARLNVILDGRLAGDFGTNVDIAQRFIWFTKLKRYDVGGTLAAEMGLVEFCDRRFFDKRDGDLTPGDALLTRRNLHGAGDIALRYFTRNLDLIDVDGEAGIAHGVCWAAGSSGFTPRFVIG